MLQTDLIASIPTLLRRHADARGSKPAYRDASTTVTYGELAARTANVAGHLADNGVQPGDKVAIFLPEFGSLGRKLFRNQPRRWCRCADQL